MALANRLLPTTGGSTERKLGSESETVISKSLLMTLGQEAEREYQGVGF